MQQDSSPLIFCLQWSFLYLLIAHQTLYTSLSIYVRLQGQGWPPSLGWSVCTIEQKMGPPCLGLNEEACCVAEKGISFRLKSTWLHVEHQLDQAQRHCIGNCYKLCKKNWNPSPKFDILPQITKKRIVLQQAVPHRDSTAASSAHLSQEVPSMV